MNEIKDINELQKEERLLKEDTLGQRISETAPLDFGEVLHPTEGAINVHPEEGLDVESEGGEEC